MRRVLPALALLATLAVIGGCTSSSDGKRWHLFDRLHDRDSSIRQRERDQENTPFLGLDSRDKSTPFRETGNERRPEADPAPDAIIAGRVLAPSGTKLTNAFIEVRQIESLGGDTKPIGVRADDSGLFLIQRLKPGKTYVLNARVEDGGVVLGGATTVTAPASRGVVISVREDNVSSQTPLRVPQPSATPAATPGPPPLDPLPSATTPPPAATPAVPAEATKRENIGSTATPGPTVPLSVPPDIFKPGPNGNPGPPPALPREPSRKPAPIYDSGDNAPPRYVPNTDFTLYDPARPKATAAWRFADHSGKLVLLDFWGTWCGPCVQELPRVARLSRDYAADGLEVIGIACEKDDSFEDRARSLKLALPRIERALQREQPSFHFGYRQMLEATNRDVQKLFAVKAFPTLVLLNRRGDVLWRSDRQEDATLDETLQRYLERR